MSVDDSTSSQRTHLQSEHANRHTWAVRQSASTTAAIRQNDDARDAPLPSSVADEERGERNSCAS